ncbi:MAG: histone deacetylase [Acidobacteriota bacterium]
MRTYYCDHFVLPLPSDHRFPMAKYRLLRERVVAEAETGPFDLRVPEPASDEDILRAHDRDYLSRVKTGDLGRQAARRIGFPWSPELVERSRRSAGGTLAACRGALEDGAAVNLAGGTHHAFADRGEGFCVFNDAAVAARAMQAEGRARRILVVDCDVHQGNGTASIFTDDPTVFTLSLHGRRNYPFRKESSDLDVALDDGTEDGPYLEALDKALEWALPRARPDLAIYVSGADPFVGDRLGRLALTKEGLADRDRRVFEVFQRGRIPVAVVMAGGYAEDVEDIVDIHFRTVVLAAQSRRPDFGTGR